jgi:hypothetical protein
MIIRPSPKAPTNGYPAPILYGVWIPGEGWLKGRKPTGEIVALSFDSKAVALETAGRVGKDAQVFYVDDSLTAIESALLEAEENRKLGFWERLRKNWKKG